MSGESPTCPSPAAPISLLLALLRLRTRNATATDIPRAAATPRPTPRPIARVSLLAGGSLSLDGVEEDKEFVAEAAAGAWFVRLDMVV